MAQRLPCPCNLKKRMGIIPVLYELASHHESDGLPESFHSFRSVLTSMQSLGMVLLAHAVHIQAIQINSLLSRICYQLLGILCRRFWMDLLNFAGQRLAKNVRACFNFPPENLVHFAWYNQFFCYFSDLYVPTIQPTAGWWRPLCN